MRYFSRLIVLPAAVLLAACVNVPTGPSIMVLPGNGKNFDQFRSDDYLCRQFAGQQTNFQTPKSAAVSSGVESAAVGAALGAAAGAAFGGGRGAAIGSGAGLLGGGLAGSSSAHSSGSISQERYDIAYIQCMYANGHRVPVSAGLVEGSGGNVNQRTYSYPPAASGRYIPPPPSGYPPSPPRY
ncbi:hypothetical protein ABO04_07055 [Nitrosomonas sp. HPC101]|uniref:YMGG-like glycine zipper-containing protein n=1 Tax=Nitrosomonas sp. HPC101 TaxID=1658667 RepID=UPI00136A0C67|nr:YMGG-like glycine zipper-containing protein [Nitrosomonas sp. HPC101]MXS85670.1 hypothetical protein [Nitrosomonas sp. HPC101]